MRLTVDLYRCILTGYGCMKHMLTLTGSSWLLTHTSLHDPLFPLVRVPVLMAPDHHGNKALPDVAVEVVHKLPNNVRYKVWRVDVHCLRHGGCCLLLIRMLLGQNQISKRRPPKMQRSAVTNPTLPAQEMLLQYQRTLVSAHVKKGKCF